MTRTTSGAAGPGAAGFDRAAWEPRLEDLRRRLRRAVSDRLRDTSDPRLARPVAQGAGDLTYGLDVPAEDACESWLAEVSRETPLSLLTEDGGWRHRGPTGELAAFDHGGPRIALDPIDGTRNLMAGLRPAWSVLSVAGPGAGEPRLSELALGIVAELPLGSSAELRVLRAAPGAGCALELRATTDDTLLDSRTLAPDDDDRCDHGYFPFFRYERAQAVELARLELAFQRRLVEREGADPRTLYDDQYISNAGQLVCLATGVYRFVADLRAHVAHAGATTSKPYDSAGAVLCAREAGALVEDAAGAPLDFPLDTRTPVSFVGFANRGTRDRLRPHLDAVLRLSAGSD